MSRKQPEKNRTQARSGSLTFLAIAAAVLILVLYFLSVGPVIWLTNRGYIDGDSPFVIVAYFPIIWLENHCEPFRQFLTAYADFFR